MHEVLYVHLYIPLNVHIYGNISNLHERIKKEAPKSKRNKLLNPYYFCGTSYGEDSTAFGDEVYEYIDNHYNLNKVKNLPECRWRKVD